MTRKRRAPRAPRQTPYRDLIHNEQVARQAFAAGEYFKCFILTQTLAEAVLRAALGGVVGDVTFGTIVRRYNETPMVLSGALPPLTLRRDLLWMNRRRNRVVHDLHFRRYDVVNRYLRASCTRAFQVYTIALRRLLELQVRGRPARRRPNP